MSSQVSTQECESATIFAALVNPAMRLVIRGILGTGGGRFFSKDFYRDLYDNLIERAPDIPLWDKETLDWASRRQGGDVSNEQRLEILNLYANNSISETGAYYAERVVTDGRKRLAAALGAKILSAKDKTPSELLEMIERASRDISPQVAVAPVGIGDVLRDVLEEIKAGPVNSITTGFQPLDDMLGGLAPGNLFVIGAGTGRGKTALAVNMMVNAASTGSRVMFFALEMSRNEVGRRLISVKGGVILRKDMSSYEVPTRLLEAVTATQALPITISAGQGFSVLDVEVAIENLKRNNEQPNLVIVDYLQLMESRGPTANRQEQVAEVSRGLKRLAMRSGIPIIVLSQLRRLGEGEDATSKPGLHHLRESGAIEQDADAVLLLSNERVEHGNFVRSLCADLAKNRHGPVGEFRISFDTQTQQMGAA